MNPSWIERLTRLFARNPLPIFGLAAVLAGLSVWATVLLPVYTSRKALLPQEAEVSKRLDAYLQRFGAASDLILVLEAAPRAELEDFASALAARLNELPEVRSATERVDLDFFLEHAFLLVPPEAMEKLRGVLDEVLSPAPKEELRDWASALGGVARWLEEPPSLDDMDIEVKVAEEGLHLLLFFADECLRWLESPESPARVAWGSLLARHGAEAMGGSYFTSRDGGMYFLFVHPAKSSSEFKDLDPMIRAVRQAGEALREAWRAEGRTPPEIRFTGLPAIEHEEFQAVQSDIVLVVVSAAALIILLIGLWLRSVRWALVVFVPMALGVLVNTGLVYLTIGHLTILTSGFTAILFGMGVDYGIFLSTRIIEELRRGRPLEEAIGRGAAAAFKGILVAGGATTGIFLALFPSDFPGFSELGLAAASGVLVVILFTLIVQPPLFRLLPPRVRPLPAPDAPEAGPPDSRATGGRPAWLLPAGIVGLALAGAAVGAAMTPRIPFDYDVLSLLPRDSVAARYQQRMVEESDFQGEVVIFTAPDLEDARRIVEAASKLESIARVESVVPLFPPDALARATAARAVGSVIERSEYVRQFMRLGDIQVTDEGLEGLLEAVAHTRELMEDGQEQAFSAGHKGLVEVIERVLATLDRLERRLRADGPRARERTERYAGRLHGALRAAMQVLDRWRDAQPLEPQDLPQMLRDRFFAEDGTVAAYAFPARSVYKPENLEALIREVYSVSPEATGFPTTHQVFSRVVVEAFHKGTLYSSLVVLLWIGLLLRSARGWLIATIPLIVGGGLMMAVLYFSGMPFNYANIIALPLVMGLAVDYGVWFAHRRRELEGISPWQVARRASPAILLAATTTLAGLGAICLASYRGVATLGVDITIGLVCCLTAALVVSPALTQLLFRRKP